MFNFNLISKFKIDYKSKCEKYGQSKQTRKSFKSILQRGSQFFKLIHNDVCDS